MRDARALAFTVRTTWGELETGAQRASVMMPGYLRLARWKLSRRLKVRTLWGVLPLLAALGVVACDLVPSDTGEGLRPILAPPPDLSKSKKAEPETPAAPWAYVLPVDHGVRADESGEGSFRAPRFHGEHNGIDLLAPVGTP
ncbi:MAG TPA: hypothetical protein VLC09_10795, partial [Polyangiaceae bacterium]|nr:hypothetical protein [Polyangiaceae bacterium]